MTREAPSTGERAGAGLIRSTVRHELSSPLLRNGYALVINGGLTGLLGLGYWVLAAHFYPAAEVGRQAAENQAMIFLGGLTALNLLLVRFLPEMGASTGRMVTRTYLAVAVAAAAAAAGFLSTLSWWGTAFTRLSGFVPGCLFVAAVVTWALFTTQDGTLTGLRRGTWVLGKNAAFGVLKIVLLVVLAAVLPAQGITLSWVGAALVLLLPAEALVRRRLVPRRAEPSPVTGAGGQAAPAGTQAVPSGERVIPSGAQIGRYLAGDYTGTLCFLATVNLVPVIVATQLDARLNAFFYMAWVLGATVDFLAVNMVMSLTVEGARDASGLAGASRAVLSRMTLVLLPVALAMVAGAEYALSLFGPGYASNGAALLRLLGFAVLPKALIELYIGVLRVRRQTRLVAGLQAARLCGIVVLVPVLTDQVRLTGPGYAVLLVSAGLSVAVFPGLLRVMRTAPAGVPGEAAPARRAPPAIGRLAAAGARWKRRVPWPEVGVWSLFCAGLCLFWIPLRDGVRLDRISGFGLITVLPVATLAGAVLLVVAFMLSLALRRRRPALLVVQLLAAVASLHGLAPALESFARPPTAWQHAGFVEYIARTGTGDYGLDARFSWPGFFAVVAFVTRAAGITDIEPLLHWFPVAVQLLYLAPLAMILRAVRASWRAKWLAAWLFVVADWVGQDYFSPQAFGYLLYLVFIGVLLNWFRPAPQHPDHLPVPGPLRWRGLLHGPFSAGERALPQARGPERAVLVVFLIAVGVVVTVSHQLTPFLIILVSGALVLGRLCTLRTLPILVAVIVASWITFFTAAYWTGHSGALFSGIGRFLTNITAGFAGRMSETSPELAALQATRAAIAMLIVSLAVFGLVRRRWWGIDDRVAPILLLAPFAALGLQQYGGEMTMRVYFFVLPGACLLAAYLFFPAVSGGAPRMRTVAAVTACGLAVAGGFLFVRFGNESFEHVRRDDARALEAMLRASPTGRVTVVWLTDPNNGGFPQMPWGLHHPERFDYLGVPFDHQSSPADLAPVIATLKRYPGGYFVTTRANNAYLVHNHGLAAGHDDRLRAALAGSGQLRPVRVTGNSAVYALRSPPPGDPPPVPEARAFSFGDTPWTPVGLVAAPLLVILLAARELRPVRPPGPVPVPAGPGRLRGWPRWRRHWSHPAVPAVLGVALIAVVVERFWLLQG